MNILILNDYIEGHKFEAAYKVRYLTAKKISERGHNVTIISPSYKSLKTIVKLETKNLINISTPGLLPVNFRKGGFGVLDLLVKAIFVLSKKFDVIHCTNGHRPAQFLPSLIGKYLTKSIIIDEWWEWFGRGGYANIRKGIIGKIISFYDLLFELPAKRFYHGVIAITYVLKNRLKNNSHVKVMHGGAEVNTLIEYNIHSARKSLNLGKDEFIIGMSNLGEGDFEDNRLFFEAFSKLAMEYENIRLFITGEKTYIKKFLSSVSYRDKIIYSGWLDFENYNKYLSACNLFVLPYRNTPRNEGRWPNKIGDYLCLNRPIISNSTGDFRNLFNDYKIGFVCKESAKAFYDIVKKILENETDLSKYHKDSRFLSNEILSFDHRIDEIINFYEKYIKHSEI